MLNQWDQYMDSSLGSHGVVPKKQWENEWTKRERFLHKREDFVCVTTVNPLNHWAPAPGRRAPFLFFIFPRSLRKRSPKTGIGVLWPFSLSHVCEEDDEGRRKSKGLWTQKLRSLCALPGTDRVTLSPASPRAYYSPMDTLAPLTDCFTLGEFSLAIL